MNKHLLYLLTFFLFSYSQAFAQGKNLSGVVKEAETSQVLPGVTVRIQGTAAATVTDKDGYFSISVPEGSNVVVFSAVGMLAYRENIDNKTSINVLLKADPKQLSEVIINAIGVETERDKFGSSVSTVKGAAIASSGETSLLTGISSKVSGVLITRNGGDPGSGGYIQIRGQNTINGNAQPLFIVDGMPVSNSSDNLGTAAGNGIIQQSRINDINPADIESMEILKGASAAALWGTRAANGVIIITTKKGKNSEGKVNITFKSSLSLS